MQLLWAIVGGLLLLTVVACAKQPGMAALTTAEAQTRQTDTARQLGTPVEVVNSVGMKLVLIPAGNFTMGSPPYEASRRDGERQHAVTLTRSFYLGSTEVTQRQWAQVMEENPSFFEGEDLPVETITWEQAVKFCRRLSAAEQHAYRLPTEAEWEYACRAGTVTPFHTGATIGFAEANFDARKTYGDGVAGEFRESTTPAGSFPPNAWGLHEMHGNVWEWCADWHGDYPRGAVVNPQGPATGTTRIVRGGCWINDPGICRSANRGDTVPVSWNFHFGFRVVRELEHRE